MTKRNRKTLADNFADGKMPTQEAFADLIDSMVNIVDDGFDKSAVDGMKVAQLDNNSKLISFYEEITVKDPVWSIGFSTVGYGGVAEDQKNLTVFYGNNLTAGLTLARTPGAGDGSAEQGIKLGINVANPRYDLDVKGVIASDGRIGREGKKEYRVQADGQWHPVISGLDGCHAFEIMAGVGKRRSGKYALLHAFVLSTFNSKDSKINYHQAHFSSKCDRIELRWVGDMHSYALEMRTQCDFKEDTGEETYIRYYITRLWFDPFMDECGEKDDSDQESM